MHRLTRFALAAAVGGAAIAATPALASAASTCSYNTSNKNLLIFDHSGTAPLRIFRTTGGELRFSDGTSSPGFACFVPGTPNTATVFNTDRIAVFGDAASATLTSGDGYHIDEGNGPLGPGATPESDGSSEVEVQIDTATSATSVLKVIGTNGDDDIRAGQAAGTPVAVNLGPRRFDIVDEDVDVSMTTTPSFLQLVGRGGNDGLSGNGNDILRNTQPYSRNMDLSGGPGADNLVGGTGLDTLLGGPGDDRMFSQDGHGLDFVQEFSGEGNDTAFIDATDTVQGEVEQRNVASSVGRMKLTPATVRARAGKPVHIALGWSHPKAWRQVRSLTLRARAVDGAVAGTVAVDPAHRRAGAHGALQVMRTSAVRHHGKAVIADLALRASTRMAGRSFQLEVQATDIHGHTQDEPFAGRLIVAR